MNTVELFCGTKSFSKVAREREMSVFTIDNDSRHCPDRVQNILELSFDDECLKNLDFLWASPPCTSFSVASVYHHWSNGVPKSDTARLGLQLLRRTIEIISISKPRKWYLENPRGMMRTIIDEIFKEFGISDYRRHTVSYCQYGDTRMKPTDIWTNDKDWVPKPICKAGASCHESAPRGSRTGTQGLKDDIARGVIPPSIFREIFDTDGVKP